MICCVCRPASLYPGVAGSVSLKSCLLAALASQTREVIFEFSRQFGRWGFVCEASAVF